MPILVMFIFREEVYRQDDPDLQGKGGDHHLQTAQWTDRQTRAGFP